MSQTFLKATIAGCILLLGSFGRAEDPADSKSPAEAFKAARPKIAQELRERDPAARLAAVRKLAQYPVVDSAKLLIPGLASSDPAIQRASFEALVAMTGQAEVAEHLGQLAAKLWKQPKANSETLGVAAVLLASESPEVQQAVSTLIDAAAGRSELGRAAAIDLVDQLGASGMDAACRALVQLAALPRCESDFALRRAIEQAFVRLRTKPAVTELIKMLATAQGEVQADISQYLTEISGQQLGNDPDHWAAWWKDAQATFEFPAQAPPSQKLPEAPGLWPKGMPQANLPSYYGLPITASKIVFVIDASGSMQGPRILAAKRELAKAVEALPAKTMFNIVAFHTKAMVWQAKLRLATEENKRSAIYFLGAVTLGSKTASYDALEAALRMDAEALYFLTDGAPTAGKIVNPPQIVTAISQQNRYRRLTINAIGIGVNSPVFETFLATLADQNYGRFERVDQ